MLSGTGEFATRFARIDSHESFRANRNPIFIARQADSHESLEFPIRANHATKSPGNPCIGRTPRGSCNNTRLLGGVLRRFFKGSAFLEGFLEGTLCKNFSRG